VTKVHVPKTHSSSSRKFAETTMTVDPVRFVTPVNALKGVAHLPVVTLAKHA
jgi:hypothetical protein